MLYYAYMDSSRIKLARKLKEKREKMGITQFDVATKAKVSISYYARVERGEVNPSFEILNKIVRVLKLNSSEIFSL